MLSADAQTGQEADGGLLCVAGLSGAAVATGIQPDGRLDLALIVAERPMNSAAMFTTNSAAAAPVRLCRERLERNRLVRSIVINSGNANALTGRKGREDAEAMLDTLEESCGGPGLVLSTGVIGEPLNLPPILDGIRRGSTQLGPHTQDVASAILTTDTRSKLAAAGSTEGRYRVAGIAKGSGMIHPNMATMLAVMATDAPVNSSDLDGLLKDAVARSFHEISVDGETSTNDAVVLLAGNPATSDSSTTGLSGAHLRGIAEAVTEVARSLALQIVRDGEGMSRLMHLTVDGAATEDEARRVARAIACSSLVKTALAGGDANWGRILSAAGSSGVPISPDEIELNIGGMPVFRSGMPVDNDADALNSLFSVPEVHVSLDLGRGRARARMATTDLTHRYVEINADYRT